MSIRSAPEEEVWQREVASWEYLKTGDLQSYLSLLHDDVVAWPSRRPMPAGKDAIFQHLVAMLPA
jgi:ketosteroid isomerase-like protein